MPRTRRNWISQQAGSFHLISRTARDTIMFDDEEKEYFLRLLETFASGFYVDIHAFCLMGTHFHILATGLELNAENACEKELYRRYKLMYGKNAEPPVGSYRGGNTIVADADGGTPQRANAVCRLFPMCDTPTLVS